MELWSGWSGLQMNHLNHMNFWTYGQNIFNAKPNENMWSILQKNKFDQLHKFISNISDWIEQFKKKSFDQVGSQVKYKVVKCKSVMSKIHNLWILSPKHLIFNVDKQVS